MPDFLEAFARLLRFVIDDGRDILSGPQLVEAAAKAGLQLINQVDLAGRRQFARLDLVARQDEARVLDRTPAPVEYAGPHAGWRDETIEHPRRLEIVKLCRCLRVDFADCAVPRKRCSNDLGLRTQRLHALIDQRNAYLLKPVDPGAEHQKRQEIEADHLEGQQRQPARRRTKRQSARARATGPHQPGQPGHEASRPRARWLFSAWLGLVGAGFAQASTYL